MMTSNDFTRLSMTANELPPDGPALAAHEVGATNEPTSHARKPLAGPPRWASKLLETRPLLFVSSSLQDLAEERSVVADQLRVIGCDSYLFEQDIEPHPDWERRLLDRLSLTDGFLLLIGDRVGSPCTASDARPHESFTRWEIRKIRECGISYEDVLAFLLEPPRSPPREPAQEVLIRDLRDFSGPKPPRPFADEDQLRLRVTESIGAWKDLRRRRDDVVFVRRAGSILVTALLTFLVGTLVPNAEIRIFGSTVLLFCVFGMICVYLLRVLRLERL